MRMRAGRSRWAAASAVVVALALVGGGSVDAAPPGNDGFAAAQPLAPGGGMLSTTTAEATKEPGEPAHAGDDGGASVWFSWTPGAEAGGTVSIETTGSEIDTLLAVYTGAGVDALTLVGSSDETTAADGTSRVCFRPSPDATYRVAVDGYGGDSGAVVLRWGAKPDGAPCPTLPPRISSPAAPIVGSVLTVTRGDFTDAGGRSFQWLRCAGGACSPIAGATGDGYSAATRDVGTSLRVLETSTAPPHPPAVNHSAPSPVVGMTPVTTRANDRLFFSTVYDVYSVRPDGTDLRLVSSFENDQATYPAPSPDGSRLAFQLNPADDGLGIGSFIAMMNADGTAPMYWNIWGAWPDWAPDGSRFAFVAIDPGDVWNVKAIDVDTNEIVTLFSAPRPHEIYNVDWSPDGTRIAIAYNDRVTTRIRVLAADGSGPVVDLTSPPTTPAKHDVSPAWSPDGSKLLFARRDHPWNPGEGDLYAVDADGTDLRVLVDAPPGSGVGSADWSPDGAKIVVAQAHWVGGDSSRMAIVGADGGEPVPLSTGAVAAYLPKWGAHFAPPTPPPPPPTPPGGGGGGGGGGPDVEISLLVSSATPLPGTSIDVSVSVANRSPSLAARGLRATIALPADTTLLAPPVYETGNGCTGTTTLSCNLDFLSPGATSTLRFAIDVGGAGVKQITASTTMSIVDPNPANNTGAVSLEVRAPAPVTPPARPRVPQAATIKVRSGNARANTLIGSAGRDLLRGLGGNDRLFGRGGDDTLVGGRGNDRLVGGAGRDKLDGGLGADTIEARDGARDTVVCGPGRDTVVADRADLVGRSCERVKRR